MKTVILHGTQGSPEGNWFPWLKRELEAAGHEVTVPNLPTPKNQSKDSWSAEFSAQTPELDKETILIGHSCGATFMLSILETLEKPIAKSIFVSGFLDELGIPEYDELNSTFIKNNFNWEKIRKNAGEIHIFHGDNDPYVPLEQAHELSKHLKVKLNIVNGGGHLNEESGFTELPQALTVAL